MSARIPTRRLGQSALAAFRPRSTYWINSRRPFTISRPALSDPKDAPPRENTTPKALEAGKPTTPPADDPLANPLLEKYLAEQEDKVVKRPEPRTGKMSNAPSSLFRPLEDTPNLDPEKKSRLELERRTREKLEADKREYQLTALELDPAPRRRTRLERKLVIKSVAKRGRITKAVKLMRTERQYQYRSHDLPTSVKKLTKLMNQIQGKSIEDALIQLRFSKKRVARDVFKGLQIARDEAIATRGMGLGSPDKAQAEPQGENAEETFIADGTRRGPSRGEPTVIELKDGSKKTVHDPTAIYVDRAWVGRGERWLSPEFRARGRVNHLTHRTTSFSVVLKEEKTRMRLSEEIQKKRENRKLWLPLPDRPVTSQRQYCLW